jgi:hypothetical protein
MMSQIKAIAPSVVLLLVLAACSTYSNLKPPVALTPGTTDDCALACLHLRALHCKSGDPTPAGATCEAVCQNTETSGYASENPKCLAQVKACGAEEDACANPQ